MEEGFGDELFSDRFGSFESSNELLNAIHKLIVNAAHNNEVSLFTDCPHREKTGTLMLYEDAVAMRRIAKLLGHEEDATLYATLAAREAEGFNRKYWDVEKGFYDTGSQTANAMPLALGIVPETRRAGVLAHIVADIHAHDDHITTGEVGYPYLLRALTEGGHADVVMAMMMRKDPPSYGSQLAAGATALTEAWDANPRSSRDHFMLGGAEEWFYRGLGGIDFDMSRSKDERITIRPQVVSGVDWVKCGFVSKLGKIESDWKRNGPRLTLSVTVPPGATATIWVPVRDGEVLSSGEKKPGVTRVRIEHGAVIERLASGTYQFVVLDI